MNTLSLQTTIPSQKHILYTKINKLTILQVKNVSETQVSDQGSRLAHNKPSPSPLLPPFRASAAP